MKLTDLCIKRPVLSTVLSLVIILLGVVAFDKIPVRQYPKVDEPRISVWTQLEGASPQIIETQITKVLEDALAGIEGLYSMQSSSSGGESKITLTFNLNRDIDAAANDVRDKIGRIRNKLPEGVQEPRIRKADADAQAIIYLALASDRHTIEELADYAFRFLESQLEVINGVANIDIWGGGEYEMRVTLDPARLAAFKLTADEVAAAIKRQNIEKPAGNVRSKNYEIVLTTKAPLVSEKDFNAVVVGQRDGGLIRLSDVGTATMGSVESKTIVRFNEKPAIGIGITKQSTANPLLVGQQLKKELPRFQSALPQGMKLEIANDQTVFIEKSINEVYKTLLEATFLVILVILGFLRSFRAILIPIVTIPVSLIGAFFLMYALDFSINILTLFALVLAIGLVVDDAIVMLENIYRYIEEGMKPIDAAFKGAKEISFAVIAMTLTLAAVYAPIALSPGMTGKIFTEFAITLAGAVVISGFVALTLTPMMCGRLLKAHGSVKEKDLKGPLFDRNAENPLKAFWHRFDARSEVFLNKLDDRYASSLEKALKTKVKIDASRFKFKVPHWVPSTFSAAVMTISAGILISVLGLFVGKTLQSEFLPHEDQGILKVDATAPFGANLAFVDKYMKRSEAILRTVPELVTQLTIVSAPGESFSLNLMKPWEDRSRSTQQVAESLNEKLYQIPALKIDARSKTTRLASSGDDSTVSVVVKTTQSYEELKKKARSALKALSSMPEIQRPRATFSEDGQEYVVSIDRDKAAVLGIDLDVIASTLDALIGGKSISKFKRESKLFGVRIELNEETRSSPEEIMTSVYIRGRNEKKETLVPLSEVISIEKMATPIEIGHQDGFRAITVFGFLKDGYSLGSALDKAKEVISRVAADSTTLVDFSGESRRYFEESQNIYIIFLLAIAFIFLVLAAQYESWRDPWIIMLSVPMSLAGGIFMLKLFGATLNLYSQIGLVTLIGLITKHGILIVDFANTIKGTGKSRTDAVIQAARLRLRPILMTTCAMVLGAVPLAFASGAGAESRIPIGLVVVGGMSLGTLFTLYVVPAVYVFLSRKEN